MKTFAKRVAPPTIDDHEKSLTNGPSKPKINSWRTIKNPISISDGMLARPFGTNNNVPNVAENFAGQSGSVAVPEPAGLAVLGLILVTGAAGRRRRVQ
jgi:hypothetical protein